MFSFYVFIFWINFVYKKPTNLEEDGSEFETGQEILLDALGLNEGKDYFCKWQTPRKLQSTTLLLCETWQQYRRWSSFCLG